MLDHMLRAIAREHSWWRRALSGFKKPRAIDASMALLKAALLDMELSSSIWYEECQTARQG